MALWAAFAAGLSLGGLASGFLVGLLAALLPFSPTPSSLLILIVLVVALVVYDLQADVVRLPQRRSLIPQDVFLHSRAEGFFRFGLEFGSGIRTFVTSSSPYIVLVALLGTTNDVRLCCAAGLAFGLGRSVGPLQAVFADQTLWSSDLTRVSRHMERGASIAVGVGVLLLVWPQL